MRIYLETSAVNYLFENVFNDARFSSIETKKHQVARKNLWQISAITLCEIFATKDEYNRYALFDFSSCLFYDYLIASPEEIILNYLKKGCPVHECKYKLESKSLFSTPWSAACKDLSYAFQPDKQQMEERNDHFRFLGEYFRKTTQGYQLRTYQSFDEVSARIDVAFLKYVYNELSKLYGRNLDAEAQLFVAVAMQVTMMVLCFGIGFDFKLIEAFQTKK